VKALVYNGPKSVSIKNVPDPKIEQPTDALVRITTTNICGSDLHMSEGRTDIETGKILGHENLGEVIEVGKSVSVVKVGDRVCLPFNISCGFCKNCERGYTGFYLTMNPGNAVPRMATRAWVPTRADKRNICAFLSLISTA
jgi:glutathione-independent formaldehyde dehydrogenase